MQIRHWSFVSGALALTLAMVTPLTAQDPAPVARSGPISEVLVLDRRSQPIPYALVSMGNSPPRVANAEGVAQLPSPVDADSADLVVRRIGYHPFGQYAKLSEDGKRYVAYLADLPRALNPTTITARRDTPLARRGFYDRMERVSRGATVGRFITPEELDQRNSSTVSGVLAGEQSIRIQRTNGKAVLTGRQPGCPIAVILDGQRATGMAEELYTIEGQNEIRRMGGNSSIATARFLAARQSVDELISGVSVAAIEIYATVAGAPIEIQRSAGSQACGIVVIWSGSRQ
jgi:hypothetical protein